jgi:hypothetical protein
MSFFRTIPGDYSLRRSISFQQIEKNNESVFKDQKIETISDIIEIIFDSKWNNSTKYDYNSIEMIRIMKNSNILPRQ